MRLTPQGEILMGSTGWGPTRGIIADRAVTPWALPAVWLCRGRAVRL